MNTQLAQTPPSSNLPLAVDLPLAASVIMPSYNRAYDLQRTLQAFEQQAGSAPFEIIAIDDASTDGTYNVLASYHSGHPGSRFTLRVLRQSTNQGPGAARNLGLQHAQAPIIIFVGDDILVTPFFLQAHLVLHRLHPQPEVCILGPIDWPADMPINNVMRHIQGPGAQQFSYYYLKDGDACDFRHFYTSNASVKRQFLLDATDNSPSISNPIFDTCFRSAAFEDSELSYRLSKRGFRILYSVHPLVYHYHYHTAHTFAARQLHAGQGATQLIEKHPEISDKIIGEGWPARLQEMLRKSESNVTIAPQIDQVKHLEEKILLWLGVHEWQTHPRLEQACLATFQYFYLKGVLHGLHKRLYRGDETGIILQHAIARLADILLQPLVDVLI